jgi:predicted permease
MNDVFLKILPIILIFILGYFLKSIHLFKKEEGDLFLKVVFYVVFPASILISVPTLPLTPDVIALPCIAICIVLTTGVLSYCIGKQFNLLDTTFGVFIIACMIMNSGFILPFFIAVYGNKGLALVMLMDIGNALVVFSVVYSVACKYGTNKKSSMIKKLLYSPPLLSIIIALILNYTHTPLPEIITPFLQSLSYLVTPLIMLALGIYFTPSFVKIKPLISIIFIRVGIGFLLGILFVKLFNLEGVSRLVVLIGASAPVGYNTVVFSSLENLDKEFATSVVSVSILLGLILVPLLMYIL